MASPLERHVIVGTRCGRKRLVVGRSASSGAVSATRASRHRLVVVALDDHAPRFVLGAVFALPLAEVLRRDLVAISGDCFASSFVATVSNACQERSSPSAIGSPCSSSRPRRAP
jgi:hypothetical protein